MVTFNPISCFTVNPAKAEKVVVAPNDYVINPPEESSESLWLSFNNINIPQKRSQAMKMLRGQTVARSVISDAPIDLEEAFCDAREIFEEQCKEKVYSFHQDKHIYLYLIEWPGKKQIGLVGEVSLKDWRQKLIRPNENVLIRNVEEIIASTKIQGIFTGFPTLFGKLPTGVIETLESLSIKFSPMIDINFDGAKHKLIQLPNSENSGLQSKIDEVKQLYLADGHHRSMAYCNIVESGNYEPAGIPAMIFDQSQLQILRFNRVLPSLLEQSESVLLKKLTSFFDLTQITVPPLKENSTYSDELEKEIDLTVISNNKNTFTFYFAESDRWFFAKSKGPFSQDPLEKLDANYLSTYFFTQILGIEDLTRSGSIKYMPETAGSTLHQALHTIKEGSKLLILCPEASIEDIRMVSDLGLFMPPKSTLFYPKPVLGMIIKELPDYETHKKQ